MRENCLTCTSGGLQWQGGPRVSLAARVGIPLSLPPLLNVAGIGAPPEASVWMMAAVWTPGANHPPAPALFDHAPSLPVRSARAREREFVASSPHAGGEGSSSVGGQNAGPVDWNPRPRVHRAGFCRSSGSTLHRFGALPAGRPRVGRKSAERAASAVHHAGPADICIGAHHPAGPASSPSSSLAGRLPAHESCAGFRGPDVGTGGAEGGSPSRSLAPILAAGRLVATSCSGGAAERSDTPASTSRSGHTPEEPPRPAIRLYVPCRRGGSSHSGKRWRGAKRWVRSFRSPCVSVRLLSSERVGRSWYAPGRLARSAKDPLPNGDGCMCPDKALAGGGSPLLRRNCGTSQGRGAPP